MKLFEQLKPNASRMAVYAILVATALCGIAAPVYALNGKKGDGCRACVHELDG